MKHAQTNVSKNAKGEPEIFAHPDITTGTVLHGVNYPHAQNHLPSHKTNSAISYLNRGVEYYKKGELDRAIPDFDEAISLDHDFAEAYNDRGLCFINKGEMDRAIGDFDKAIQLNADFYVAYSNRGTAYKSNYNFLLAIRDYSRAIQHKPDFAAAYNNRGDIYRMIGNLAYAISNYDIALEIFPDYVEAYYSRELAYFERDEVKNTISEYDLAIKTDPNNTEAYIDRMLAYASIGETVKAMEDFNKLADMSDNNHQLYYDAQQELQKMGMYFENTTKEHAWWKIEPRPAPPGWKKTMKDLKDEVNRCEREDATFAERQWAREYEASLISPDMRFPHKGDIYEALEDIWVEYMTAWREPFTGGNKGEIKKGDRVLIDQEPGNPESIGIYAVAVDYAALEERIVPATIRNNPLYNGFYFYLPTIDLNLKFKLVLKDID